MDVVGVAMQMKKNMSVYTNLNEKTFSVFLIHTTFQIAFIELFECLFERTILRHAIVSRPSNGAFWAKFARNTDQDGRLRTIFAKIFFYILTGGCIFSPYKVFLWYLKL